jgi:hypothetical protein
VRPVLDPPPAAAGGKEAATPQEITERSRLGSLSPRRGAAAGQVGLLRAERLARRREERPSLTFFPWQPGATVLAPISSSTFPLLQITSGSREGGSSAAAAAWRVSATSSALTGDGEGGPAGDEGEGAARW